MSENQENSTRGNLGGVSHTDYRAYEEFENPDEGTEHEQLLPEHATEDGPNDE